MDGPRKVEVLYDKQCPVCDYYCQRVDVAEHEGDMVRIDARESSDLLDEVTATGLDIDEGMVVRVDDRIYYGSEAIARLARLSSRKGFINRISWHTFRHDGIARILYPALAAVRNLLLKVLGRSRINNLRIENNDRF